METLQRGQIPGLVPVLLPIPDREAGRKVRRMSEKDDRALEAMAKGSKTGIIGHGSSGVSEELRKRLSELQKQKDDVLVTPYIQEIASLRAQLEQAEAEAGALREALEQIKGAILEYHPCNTLQMAKYEFGKQLFDLANKGLSSDAGAALLEERNKYKKAFENLCRAFNYGEETDYIAMRDAFLDEAKEGTDEQATD